MNILGIETSTDILMIAATNNISWTSHTSKLGLQHASHLAPHISRLTNEIDLKMYEYDLIAVGIGPGSFTGIRIGISTAMGIARASSATVIGFSLIEAIAYSYRHFPGLLIPIIDARKKKFYSGFFRQGRQINEFIDVNPDDLSKQIKEQTKFNEPVLLTGPAATDFANIVKNDEWLVNSHYLGEFPTILFEIALAKSKTKETPITPLYLRKSEAEIGILPSHTD